MSKNINIPACYSSTITALCPPKGKKREMSEKLRQEIARIAALGFDALKYEYQMRSGSDSSFGAVFMRRRLAQLTQEDELGGLTPDEQTMLDRIAQSDGKCLPKSGRPSAPVRGTVYSRMYKGRRVEVKSTGYGKFEYDGKQYGSLTACVMAITGTHYSGRKFFGVGGAS